MAPPSRKIVIIGAGIAGLCAAVYARRCGYEVEVLEQHYTAGGLATSWRRGDYTFETCLHWLLGSNPDRPFYRRWREVFDIEKLHFVYPERYERVEAESGQALDVYADVDRMEAEFLKQAPQDAVEIRRFAAAIRRFAEFEIPDPGERWPRCWLTLLRLLPLLPWLRRWSAMTCEEAGRRFKHKLLRHFFGAGDMARLSAVAVVLMMSRMTRRDAGYAVGGSQAIIKLIVDRLQSWAGGCGWRPGSRRSWSSRTRRSARGWSAAKPSLPTG